ncbi:ribokinase [Deinococcus metalli]|uniref:Ribokinase n=1 Tax=Deinococcus metalli TaxID=1141878 RepID=A0A7W8NRD4_9DEIO|nr:ribokinase [Deinococcus metalli]MBB5377795.1 ribokinase [Deinococcus metalli]GHF55881.1 ribokinase [Deinococcus metalli]
MTRATVLVLGSLNLDILLRVPHLPRAGETMHSLGLEHMPGGKGANQAAACAALGTPTRMIGAVGTDDAGERLLDALRDRGVDVGHVRRIADTATGQAYIHIAPDGENTITLHGGANALVGAPELAALDAALPGAHALLLQLEVPLDVTVEAARRARAAGVTVILDPAPAAPSLPADLLAAVDLLTPNEHEARTLSGQDDVRAAAHTLLDRGVRHVIVKRGAQGALLLDRDGEQTFSAPPVQAVSTVAAGDTFNGALAAALAGGARLPDAVAFAVRAASLRVTRPAGYGHLPTRGDMGYRFQG